MTYLELEVNLIPTSNGTLHVGTGLRKMMRMETDQCVRVSNIRHDVMTLLVGFPVPDELPVPELDRPCAICNLEDDRVEDCPVEVTVLGNAAIAGLGGDLSHLHTADTFAGRRHHFAVAATTPSSVKYRMGQ